MSASDELYRTERLTIRRLNRGDVDALLAVYGNATAMRWVDDGQPLDREGCVRWVEVTLGNYATRGYGMSALVRSTDAAVVGFCGIVHPDGQAEAEIKYALREDCWGQGYATEAVIGMLAYAGQTLGLSAIMATTAPENAASHRVLEKAGMVRAELVHEEDGSRTQVFRWPAALYGSCLCGHVSYRIDRTAGPFVLCHCRSCRKASGSAFGANLPVPADGFRLLRGAAALAQFESSPGKRRHFCSRCGTPVFNRLDSQPDTVRVRLGTLDGDFRQAPAAHIFTADAAPWLEGGASAPRFPGWPDAAVLALPGSRQEDP